MEEITIVTQQAGEFITASAFIGGCFAGSATCTDKRLASEQARAYARELAKHGQLQPLDTSRLGARAAVPRFGLVVRNSGHLPATVVAAAQLAALAVPMQVDEPLLPAAA